MGWKNIQQAFAITRHIVTSSPVGVAIGTASIPDLISIDGSTGEVIPHELWPLFAATHYPKIHEASSDELRELVNNPDHFERFIPVYTFEDGKIVQRFCGEPGYPNVTHDGRLMHENLYSTDYDAILRYAQRIIYLEVKCAKSQIERLEGELIQWNRKLDEVIGVESLLNEGQPQKG